MLDRVILSLCDYSGNWTRPYREAGYIVQQIDLAFGQDVRLLPFPGNVAGILAAPPCTMFAVCGARWRAQEKREGSYTGKMIDALSIVDACLRLVAICQPEFWALENPVGTLTNFLGEPRLRFNPCDFAGWNPEGDSLDGYTKRTCLWGNFVVPEQRPVDPQGHRHGQPNQWYSKVGGKSEKTKQYRSVTPLGFAYAFASANP